MFGRGNLDLFTADPFFSDHTDRMSAFDQFFSQDQFRRINENRSLAIDRENDGGRHRRNYDAGREDKALAPRDGFMAPFQPSFFTDMFSGFDRSMKQMEEAFTGMPNSDEGQCFSYSAVSSYSKGENGQPKHFEATTAERKAPGGIRETRKTVRDSEREMDKMAIGHHIKDRGHVVERSRNTRTGHQDEKQDYININQNDAEAFNSEWRGKAEPHFGRRALNDENSQHARRAQRRGLEAPRHADKKEERRKGRESGSRHVTLRNTPDVRSKPRRD